MGPRISGQSMLAQAQPFIDLGIETLCDHCHNHLKLGQISRVVS